jgi:hypothetical protein
MNGIGKLQDVEADGIVIFILYSTEKVRKAMDRSHVVQEMDKQLSVATTLP